MRSARCLLPRGARLAAGHLEVGRVVREVALHVLGAPRLGPGFDRGGDLRPCRRRRPAAAAAAALAGGGLGGLGLRLGLARPSRLHLRGGLGLRRLGLRRSTLGGSALGGSRLRPASRRRAGFCGLKRSFTIESFTCAVALFLSSAARGRRRGSRAARRCRPGSRARWRSSGACGSRARARSSPCRSCPARRRAPRGCCTARAARGNPR